MENYLNGSNILEKETKKKLLEEFSNRCPDNKESIKKVIDILYHKTYNTKNQEKINVIRRKNYKGGKKIFKESIDSFIETYKVDNHKKAFTFFLEEFNDNQFIFNILNYILISSNKSTNYCTNRYIKKSQELKNEKTIKNLKNKKSLIVKLKKDIKNIKEFNIEEFKKNIQKDEKEFLEQKFIYYYKNISKKIKSIKFEEEPNNFHVRMEEESIKEESNNFHVRMEEKSNSDEIYEGDFSLPEFFFT